MEILPLEALMFSMLASDAALSPSSDCADRGKQAGTLGADRLPGS
jgi:hypothetical protein